MKLFANLIPVLGFLAAVPSAMAVDFQSISCKAEYEGINNLSLARQANGTYNLTISKHGGTPNDVYAGGVTCKALESEIPGALPLVNCQGYYHGVSYRALFGQLPTFNWVDINADGSFKRNSTGLRYEVQIENPALANPFTQIYRFRNTDCSICYM